MSDVYVFDYRNDSDDADFGTLGLVGALTPTKCEFTEEANGMSEIQLEHPLDSFGRYKVLQRGNILKVGVPVRTTIDAQLVDDEGNPLPEPVYTIQQMKIKVGVTKSKRELRAKKDMKGKCYAYLDARTQCVIVGKYTPMKNGQAVTEKITYKCVTKKGTGWVLASSLEEDTKIVIDPNKDETFDEKAPAWQIVPQLFRITKADKSITDVKVTAQHITYDLIGNLTSYKTGDETTVTLKSALDGLWKGCKAPVDEFTTYCSVPDKRTGIKFELKNPMECILGDEDGLAQMYDVGLVRNNYEMYFMKDPGVNRGVRIEYRKNMTGIEYSEDDSELVTRIIPFGKNKAGKEIGLLDTYNNKHDSSNKAKYEGTYPNGWIDSGSITDYPKPYAMPHVYKLECTDCQTTKDTKDEYYRVQDIMVDQAKQMFADGCDKTKVTVTVDFLNLGDSEEYKQFRGLENVYLFDYVRIINLDIGVDTVSRVCKIVWDCTVDRMSSMEIGETSENLANSKIAAWQIPSGFSGSKIGNGTVDGVALTDDAISARHIQAGSITANAIAAGAVTADAIDVGAITADKLNAQDIFADNAEISQLLTTKIQATDINADNIKAGTLTASHVVLVDEDTGVAYMTIDKYASAAIEAASIAQTTANAAVPTESYKKVVGTDTSGNVSVVGNAESQTGVVPRDNSVDIVVNGTQAASVSPTVSQFGALVVRVVNGCLCFSVDTSAVEEG